MFNKVFLLGNLGSNPVVRQTKTGTAVANFRLATHRRWKNREGELQEQTEWHNVVCFSRQAEIAREYLVRGKQIFVEGRLQTRTWEDSQTGESRYRTEVVCEKFQMLGPGNGASNGAPSGGAELGDPPNDGAPDPEDDDIPF